MSIEASNTNKRFRQTTENEKESQVKSALRWNRHALSFVEKGNHWRSTLPRWCESVLRSFIFAYRIVHSWKKNNRNMAINTTRHESHFHSLNVCLVCSMPFDIHWQLAFSRYANNNLLNEASKKTETQRRMFPLWLINTNNNWSHESIISFEFVIRRREERKRMTWRIFIVLLK